MVKTKIKKWTYDDYYALSDEKRYEIIKGELIEISPAPSSKHQRIILKIVELLLESNKKEKGYEILFSPIDVILSDTNVFQPDILMVFNENKNIIKERGVFGAPDVVFEVISRSTEQKDRNDKFNIYEKHRVKEYWIVDPFAATIEVFVKEKGSLKSFCYAEDAKYAKSKLIKGFKISPDEIFKD